MNGLQDQLAKHIYIRCPTRIVTELNLVWQKAAAEQVSVNISMSISQSS